MIDLIKFYSHLFNDKSASLSRKIAYFIILLSIIGVIEFHFDFSYNYFINNKIEQLKTINELKNIYKNDSLQLNNFKSIEKNILQKEHYSSLFKHLYFKSLNIYDEYSKNESDTSSNEKEPTVVDEPIRSVSWMVFSSNYFLIFIFIIALFLPFSEEEHRKGSGLVGLIAGLILLSLLIYIITLISYQIPLINDNPTWNYILNAIIHSIFIYFAYRLFKNEEN